MRILIATGIYPPRAGGPSYYAASLKREFELLGHTVTVRTYAVEHRLPSALRHVFYFFKTLPAYIGADVVIVLDTFSVGFPIAVLRTFLGGLVILRTGGDFLWEQYIERTKERVVLSDFYAKQRILSRKERIIKVLTRFVLQRVDNIVFSTEYQRSLWVDVYGISRNRTTIIENAYYGAHMSEPAVAPHFISICRPITLKNIDILKAAVENVSRFRSDIRLSVFHDIPHAELLEHIRAARAVVIPSLSEISPNLAIEAVSCGTPVILTRENGIMNRLGKVVFPIDPLDQVDIERALLSFADDAVYTAYREELGRFSYCHSYANIAREFITLCDRLRTERS